MIEHPPFLAFGSSRDDEMPPEEHERVPFYLLAYARCLDSKTNEAALVGLYLCLHPGWPRFILREYDASTWHLNRHAALYRRPFRDLAGALLWFWTEGVSPFYLRLCPRREVAFSNREDEKHYEQERRVLCTWLNQLRWRNKVAEEYNRTPGSYRSDPSFPPLAFGQSPEEDEEMAVASVEYAEAKNETHKDKSNE